MQSFELPYVCERGTIVNRGYTGGKKNGNKMGESRPYPAGETHKPDSRLVSSQASQIQTF